MKQTMHVGDNKFLIIYIVTVLLFYTSGVCFAIVYQEIGELNTESGTDISITQMEIVFFTVVELHVFPLVSGYTRTGRMTLPLTLLQYQAR